jgi:predicted HAD superfamily Cof-like phosphohydrolase
MTSLEAMLREFHTTFGLTVRNQPEIAVTEAAELRQSLILEEVQELTDAVYEEDIVEIADALADIVYIAYGTALEYGIPLDKVLEEVHRSNMAKRVDGKVIRREDGKVLKPEGWQAPRIAEILGKSND